MKNFVRNKDFEVRTEFNKKPVEVTKYRAYMRIYMEL